VTEADWLSTTDPTPMLGLLRDRGLASERKLRLYGVAFTRRVWHLLTAECFRDAVEVAERFADGQASKKELNAARRSSGAALEAAGLGGLCGEPYWALGCAWSTTRSPALNATMYPLWVFTDPGNREWQVSLVREVFGNPFRPPSALASSCLTPAVLSLAQAAYDHRLDPARLAELADALEHAGCTDAGLLGHLRGEGHVRGCFAVDAILGKT
jgi:hypothetical protein